MRLTLCVGASFHDCCIKGLAMIRGFVTASLGCKARGAACLLIVAAPWLTAQTKEAPLTVRVANQTMVRWPDGHIGPKGAPTTWGFELGIVLAGMNAAGRQRRNAKYLDYVQHRRRPVRATRRHDRQLRSAGIFTEQYPHRASATDAVSGHSPGKIQTRRGKIRRQIATQPRTASGGVWHSRATPNLMLLDDQFMLAPFYAEYAATSHLP